MWFIIIVAVIILIICLMKKGNSGSTSNMAETQVNEMVVSLVKVVVNKIAPRYPWGGNIFVADKYVDLTFWDYSNDMNELKDAIEGVVHPGLDPVKYFNLTDEEISSLRLLLKDEGRDGKILITGQHCGKSTIDAVRSIVTNLPDGLKDYRFGIGTDTSESISWWWDY